MKYYAIKKGRQTGLFTSWDEAKSLVIGFKGAIYKSFTSQSEALAYLNNTPQSVVNTATSPSANTLDAYVDGSFDARKGFYGSGIVLLKNGVVLDELSIAGNDPLFIESYQIAGEVIGCIKAIEWAIQHDYSSITISYDYEGIHAWANGNWQTKKPISQYYKKQFDTLKPKINVTFNKVKAHTGVTYNERADELAKLAIKQA